jgi:hypothetical protein
MVQVNNNSTIRVCQRVHSAPSKLIGGLSARHPAQVAQDRHGHFAEHAPHPVAFFQRVSPPATLQLSYPSENNDLITPSTSQGNRP